MENDHNLQDYYNQDCEDININIEELYSDSEEDIRYIFESLDYINRIGDRQEYEDELGIKLLGIEEFYSSNHFSLEGVGEFIKGVFNKIIELFKAIIRAIGNKLIALKNLFFKGAIREQRESFKKMMNKSELWNNYADKVELTAYNYTKSPYQPHENWEVILKAFCNKLKESNDKKQAIIKKLPIEMKSIERNKNITVSEIRNKTNELSAYAIEPLVDALKPLVNKLKDYTPSTTVSQANSVNAKEGKVVLSTTKSVFSVFGEKAVALAVILEDKSKKKIEKQTKKFIELFKDYTQAVRFIFDETTANMTFNTFKLAIAMAKLTGNSLRGEAEIIKRAFIKATDNKVTASFVRGMFDMDRKNAETAMSIFNDMNNFATNLLGEVMRRVATVMQGFVSCKKLYEKG